MPPHSEIEKLQTVNDENSTDVPTHKELTLKDAYGQYYNSYRTLWGLVGAPLKWKLTIVMILYHAVALTGLLTFPYIEKWRTTLWTVFLGIVTVWGITAGAHRYWTHKCYKATTPMRLLLAFCYSLSGQYTIFNWVRLHRIHHKFSDTTADPHDIYRGVTFAQIGFILLEKHPECIRKGKQVDCSDLLADPIVKFNKDYFPIVNLLCHYTFPTIVPMIFWGETFYWAFLINALRFIICLGINGMVNSVNHNVGIRPYNRKHQSTDVRWFSWFALGEGYHNYHHTFPYDYKAAELQTDFLNFTTFVLDLFASIGWIYDIKRVSPEMVKRTVIKNGDGSHKVYGKSRDNLPEDNVTSPLTPHEYEYCYE